MFTTEKMNRHYAQQCSDFANDSSHFYYYNGKKCVHLQSRQAFEDLIVSGKTIGWYQENDMNRYRLIKRFVLSEKHVTPEDFYYLSKKIARENSALSSVMERFSKTFSSLFLTRAKM